MFKSNPEIKAYLDSIGKLVLRAASGNDAAADAAAESPFLYPRIRAAIAERQALDDSAGWSSLFSIARRAVPAMALITLLTVVPTLVFLESNSPTTSARFDEDAFFDTRGNSLPGAILANRDSLSRDDVFGIVVDRNDRGSNK